MTPEREAELLTWAAHRCIAPSSLAEGLAEALGAVSTMRAEGDRLRSERNSAQAFENVKVVQAEVVRLRGVVAERDAALAGVERLRTLIEDRYFCEDHANHCVSWCSGCKQAVDWEKRMSEEGLL